MLEKQPLKRKQRGYASRSAISLTFEGFSEIGYQDHHKELTIHFY